MCYSVESSAKTTLLSLSSIIYLMSSNIPHFQWIGTLLIGWCSMQFVELLLWMTEPTKGCTLWNKIITLTLIPLVLLLQPVGSLMGSLWVIPWEKSSDLRKKIIIFYTLLMFIFVCRHQYYKPDKLCTTVTKGGHLYWSTKIEYTSTMIIIEYFLWAFYILLPLFLFWNKSFILPLLLILLPTVGFIIGLKTDARASIWCHYTSYTSIIASILLFLHQTGIYKIL